MTQCIMNMLARDERGNIMIIGTFGILIIAAILALSIDYGKNAMTQSDAEQTLTAITKQAGEEFTYWQIRKQVNTAASGLGLPPVQNLATTHPGQYILEDASLTETEALGRLKTWVETEVRKKYPSFELPQGNPPSGCTSGRGTNPFICLNSQQKPMLKFVGTTPQSKDFYRSGPARNIQIDSATLINTIDDRTVASQVVFSLDKDSLDQLGSGPSNSQMQSVFTLVSQTISNLAVPTNNVYSGLTIGNLPTTNPALPAGGAGVTTTVNGNSVTFLSANQGTSGSIYDNAGLFGSLTGQRFVNSNRKYVYEAEFTATDATSCKNPVWTYLNRVVGTCKRAYNWSEITFDNTVVCNAGPPPPPPVTVSPPCVVDPVTNDCPVIHAPLLGQPPPPPPLPAPPPPPCNSVCRAVR